MKKFLSFFLFALCLTVAANAQPVTYDFEDGTIPAAFTNDETYPWIVIDTTDDDGNAVRCIRSGNRGVHSSTSAIETTVGFLADGYITFDALCMGEGTNTAWDKCIFYIDGEAQFTYGAHIAGWNHYSYPVTAGSHAFKWVYTKDASANYPGDAFFVDNIVFGLGTDPCEVPSNVTVSDITANSATVGWTGNSTEYNVHYRVPGVETDTVFFEDFEDADNFVDGLPNGWTSIDHDGDGYNWIYHNNYGLSSGRITSHSGVGVMYSQSYDFDDGALTPDNWLITPQIELGNIVKVWLTAQDPSYPDEHFAIYLSTTGNDVTDFTVTLLPKTKATGEYVEYTADLSAYAGQQGYIAIRHFNVTDEFYLNVDDFGVYNEEPWTTITATGNTAELTDLAPETTYEVQVQGICESGMTEWTEPVMFTTEEETEEPCVINTIEITGFTEPVYGATPDYDVNVPADANYTLQPAYISWMNKTTMSFVSSTETFEYGSYDMYCYVFANEGCTFADEVSITINGNASAVAQTYFEEDENDYFIRTIEYTLTNPCSTPTNLTVSDITSNSATVSWTGNQTGYNVLYGSDMIAYYADFEANRIGWTAIDADNDENSWNWVILTYGSHSGNHAFRSMSVTYNNENLAPDNWLISPTLDLGGTMSVWLRSGDNDHFAIYLAPGGGSEVDDFTVELVPETTALDDWTEYTADLSSYVGQQGAIAIRHFNSDEKNGYLDLDDFSVFEEQEPTLTATGNTIDLTGLEPGTTYKVLVQGICEDGVTEWTSPVEFTTEEPMDEPCVISEINIEGFTAPEWGEHPDNEMTVPEDANYTLGSAVWVSWDEANHQEEMMTTEDVFDNEDVVYYMYFQITPKEGCTFVNPYYVTVTIDDNSEIVEGKNMDEGIFYAWTEEYTVTSPCVINTIEITGFTEPVYGATPDYDVEVPADANYTLDNVFWSEYNSEMTAETFVAHWYYMVFDIAPNEGCIFADNLTVTINGDASLVDPDYGGILSDVYKYRVFTLNYYLSVPPCETPTNVTVSDITTNNATVSWTGSLEEYNVFYGTNLINYRSDFETDESVDGWSIFDADGDGYNWEWFTTYREYSHSGTSFLLSRSYNSEALDPDNWLIAPTIDLGGTMSVWVRSWDDGYLDNFAIYLTTNPDYEGVEDFNIELVGETTAPYEWTEYTADLSAYVGQRGAIAIRHFNSADNWYLLVDDFSVIDGTAMTATGNSIELTNLDPETTYEVQVQGICEYSVSAWSEPEEFTTEAEPTCVINEVNVIGYEPPVAGENSQDHLNITVPDNENYFLVESAYSPSWYDEDADDYFNGSFVGGTRYSVGVEIYANDGCVFANNCTFFFDGDENLVNPEFTGVDGEDNTTAYIWTMPEQATETTSPCETPTNLTATNITATSAKLGWTGNLEQYTVRYKDDAASDWTTATTANSTLALTGLTPATTYTAQVQGDCGSGAKSVTDWSDPVTFTTLSGTVEPGECSPAVDCEGTSYPTVKIGDVCWMTKNLAAEACVTTGNVYSYVNDQFPDEDANVETYGLLYDEEAAFATGICPEGYTLPTTEQFEYLKNNFTVEELRNGTGWIVNTGTNGTGFSWDGSGFYNGTSDNFEHMLMEGYLWAVDMTSGTPQPAMYKMMYYCNEIVRVYDFNDISASVRCVKIAEPQPEPEPEPEPEPFRCGTSNLKIGENSYETVQIGTQCWTKTNLRETKDKNGNDFIDGISAAAGSFDEYEAAVIYIPTEETWSENNSSVTYNENTFGYYYNWVAANNVCPDGWHLPSDEEWTQLEDYVSNAQDEEGNFLYRCDPSDATSIAKALASETDVWSSYAGECYPGDQSVKPNNATGFSAVPAGRCDGSSFYVAGYGAYFWSSTHYNSYSAWYRNLYYFDANVLRIYLYKGYGFSVRCLRD